MKLIKVLSRSRRDFQGEYKCEFCGHIETDSSMNSYDDRFYHDNVIPSKVCVECGKSTISEGGEVTHTPTLYPDWFQI